MFKHLLSWYAAKRNLKPGLEGQPTDFIETPIAKEHDNRCTVGRHKYRGGNVCVRCWQERSS